MPSPTTNHQPPVTAAHPRARRSGFTLTELLVVIAIIAVLASLVSVGVMRALDTAKQTRIKLELDQIDLALKAYKDKFGDYPPCDLTDSGTNVAKVKSHVARAFPRYYNLNNVMADLKTAGLDTANPRPDQALVFWLSGFNSSPTEPFKDLATLPKADRKDRLFDFDESRLVSLNNPMLVATAKSYLPPQTKYNAPYIYFDYRKFGTDYANPYYWNPQNASPALKSADIGFPSVIIEDVNSDGVYTTDVDHWANQDSYQLIAPGIDGNFGHAGATVMFIAKQKRLYPAGTGYDIKGTEEDNVTNFCSKARIGDARP